MLDRRSTAPRRELGVLPAFMVAVLLALCLPRQDALADSQPFVRQGDKILVPADSALRGRLTIAPVSLQTTQRKLVLPAIVEADPARTISLLPALAGRVIALRVGLGDRVRRGQELLFLDSPDLAQAYDDNDKAEDAFHLAERTLARQEQQAKINAISAQDLDQARSDFAQARAEYGRTQARLRAIEAPIQARPRLLAVKSPLDGTVTTLSVAEGAVVNDPTQPLMTINDLSVVWVTALVPEQDIALVAKDQEAEIGLAAYPGERLVGKVSFIGDLLESDSRRDKVRIAFDNPRRRLKPNMFATVSLNGPPLRRVLLPTSALLMNNDRISVFVETAPWTFERRIVDADLRDASEATILSGLEGGERVVVKGGVLLND
jgi:cobalt-zinc-cadmium efflux system membrane fusion protein